MSPIGHILCHPLRACGKWWRAYTGNESNEDLVEREEVRLRCLRFALALYKANYARFPAILRDLCDNNYEDPEWGGPFIPCSGEDTFRDSFGYSYEYEVSGGSARVVSLGLERTKSRAAGPSAPPNGGPAERIDNSEAVGGPPSVS
jgi:hypothetical protein